MKWFKEPSYVLFASKVLEKSINNQTIAFRQCYTTEQRMEDVAASKNGGYIHVSIKLWHHKSMGWDKQN